MAVNPNQNQGITAMDFSDDRLWTIKELADFIGYQESTVSRLVSQSPDKLPPRVPNLSKPRWLPSAVRAWAMGAGSTANLRRGRPRLHSL